MLAPCRALLVSLAILSAATAARAGDGDDGVKRPGRVVGRIMLNSLANVGGGLTGAAGGALLGAPGGGIGAAIGATLGLGLGILTVAPAYMQAVCHAQGCDGSYAVGAVGGLGVSILFIAIEVGLADTSDDSAGSRVIAYAVLGPILQAAIYELSVRPRRLHSGYAAPERGWTVAPFVSLAPENRSLGLSLSAGFR